MMFGSIGNVTTHNQFGVPVVPEIEPRHKDEEQLAMALENDKA